MIATRDSLGTEPMTRTFVAPQAPMLVRIVREREAWYSNLTIAGFEAGAHRPSGW